MPKTSVYLTKELDEKVKRFKISIPDVLKRALEAEIEARMSATETWALFSRKSGEDWAFKGFTVHEEIVVEFEESADDEETRVGVCLEESLRRM